MASNTENTSPSQAPNHQGGEACPSQNPDDMPPHTAAVARLLEEDAKDNERHKALVASAAVPRILVNGRPPQARHNTLPDASPGPPFFPAPGTRPLTTGEERVVTAHARLQQSLERPRTPPRPWSPHQEWPAVEAEEEA